MPTYYWEKSNGAVPGCGEFEAYHDEEALEKMPGETAILYRESDTPTGLPFVVIFGLPEAKRHSDDWLCSR